MFSLPQTDWDESVIRAAYFCQADILKNMLRLHSESVNLTDEGLLLAEFPLANYSEGSLSMDGQKKTPLKNQADTLAVILQAMGRQKASQPIFRIKTFDAMPYGKKGEYGMVFDSYGNTILHMIAFYEGQHFLPVLRQVGLNVSQLAKCKNSKGQTPINIALDMMANMPLAFAIQNEVYTYEQNKMYRRLLGVQKQNAYLTKQINMLNSQKITSWSVSGSQNSAENYIRFEYE